MSLEKVRLIETKYAVETITANGHQVWPFIRFSMWAYFQAAVQPVGARAMSLKTFFVLIGQFFYGFRSYFRKYEYLAFSDSSERKKVNDKWVDKSVDLILTNLPNVLLIELPLPRHYKKAEIPTDFISSKLPLYGLEWIYTKIFLSKIDIQNEHIIVQILQELDFNFDYRSVLKRNLAQFKIGKLLQKLYNPRGVVIQCSYTNIGYTKAFKDASVKVVEVQHGLITSSHEAYNVFKKLDSSYFPDYFLSYGKREIEILSQSNFMPSIDNVIPVGHFYLDMINASNKTKEEIIPEVQGYDFGVAITGQMLPGVEEKLLEFLSETAIKMQHVAFFYLPRNESSHIFKCQLPKNLINAFGKDTYEVIRLTSCHSTIFSTCAIEALVLGTPNILINIDNLAKSHLYEIIGTSESSVFVDTVEEYINCLNNFPFMPKAKVINANSNLVLSGYRENIRKVTKAIFDPLSKR